MFFCKDNVGKCINLVLNLTNGVHQGKNEIPQVKFLGYKILSYSSSITE